MRYPPDLLDEIRSRLPVSRIVERRVKLKRAGREYIGLSPFKTERTPSFTVNDHKGFYHCFASGEHGDIFKFLMVAEGLTFPEAVERLAAEAGVALPAPTPADDTRVAYDSRLHGASEEACHFFQAALRSREGEAARAYLERRGITLAEVSAFRLGYAPDSKSSLKSFLSQKGFTLDEMQDSGLLIHGEDIAVPYDRFRGRLIFPILDAKRRVIAFGGRALVPDQQPKYLNSPETALFHKGHVLFNLAAAREAARTAKSLIVAEGYMDVIALTRAGFANAVAPLGTALTAEQFRLIWTLAPMPVLCFDGDAAGQKAAYRALDNALPHLEPGRSLQFAFLPEGRDPDDMVRGGEQDMLAKLLSQPISLIDVLWSSRACTPSPGDPRATRKLGRKADGVGQPNRTQESEISLHFCASRALENSAPGAGSGGTKAGYGIANPHTWPRPVSQGRGFGGEFENRKPAGQQDRTGLNTE